ncbi:MAG: hypothetical protein NZ529_08230 [Cytophagaceae bacterium]|nr:hypothetical protein [Cytophagaceae bacterium]MDW8456770.1 hypothetical protein [Cytophagaceae bacterium]
MKRKLRKIVSITFLSAVLLPFILVTDLYPFLRFGMFAEPLKYGYEMFSIQIKEKHSQNWLSYNPEYHGLSKSLLDIIVRRYYYTKRIEEFCDEINRIHNNSLREISVVQQIIYPHSASTTSIVYSKCYE